MNGWRLSVWECALNHFTEFVGFSYHVCHPFIYDGKYIYIKCAGSAALDVKFFSSLNWYRYCVFEIERKFLFEHQLFYAVYNSYLFCHMECGERVRD